MERSRIRLGEALIEAGYITPEDLSHALAVQRSHTIHKKLGEILVDEGVVDEKKVLQVLSKQLGFDLVDLYEFQIDKDLIARFPITLLHSAHILPLEQNDAELHIATSDPLAYDALDRIERLAGGRSLIVHLASRKEIDRLFQHLEIRNRLHDLALAVKREMTEIGEGGIAGNEESAVLQLIRLIIRDAVLRNGSDIHIEPSAHDASVRVRIDGILRETYNFDLDVYHAVASRIKILGNLDISERRRAQDGRFSLSLENHLYDFRLSTTPTLYGESIVMRILDRQKVLLRLQELGFGDALRKQFEEAIRQPYGIILITGPTGSGKTTTLYAALNEIKSIENKVMTIEDPIEYHLPLIQQVQVNEKIGYGFAEALRSFLRQDPDIIMVGEIRDLETLDAAAQAAQTGHLVFSTLHTNDAPGAINRTIQMGLAPYLVADAIIAIVAQRLIRKICPYCKTVSHPPRELPERIRKLLPPDATLYRGQGCSHCEMTGYLGRTLTAEIFLFDERISEAVSNGERKAQIVHKAMEWGLYRPLIYDGIEKVIQGITTLDEILRVTRS